MPATWLFILYFTQKYGYGRILASETSRLDASLSFALAVVAVYSIFIHLPAQTEKKKEDGKMQIYYLLGALTLGVYPYARFVVKKLNSEPARGGNG